MSVDAVRSDNAISLRVKAKAKALRIALPLAGPDGRPQRCLPCGERGAGPKRNWPTRVTSRPLHRAGAAFPHTPPTLVQRANYFPVAGARRRGGALSLAFDTHRERKGQAFGVSLSYRAGAGAPPALALGAALTLPNWVPSGSVTAMNCPPAAPSRNGWITALIGIPGVRVWGFQPCRVKTAGPPISIAHCTVLPCASFTFIRIQLCGLVHWNSFTVPSRVATFSASNIAKE